ncbi:BppU family phage baseplate upper protein [Ellagibacter isourolithinifaciens]|uniref:BppU family phage baseplate upper protein n=1 Tax=Ellagibacter isourolithinifaciens TaxID=2137581 RepID=UPI003A8D1A79
MPTKAVSLNVDKSGSFAAQTVRISQGDENSTSIVATILDGAQPFDLTGKSVRFKCELPGGKVFVDDSVAVSDAKRGVVTFTPPVEVAAAAGKVTSALFEVYSDGYAIHTTKMVIDVDPTPTVVEGAVCELALLSNYRSGEQASWTHPTKNGMAFAGWYKDAALKYPCSASDTEGAAWAKFVKVADLFQFMGCSLNMSGNVPAEYTTPRFSYTMSIPDGVTFIENSWYFKKVSDPTKPDVRSPSNNNIVQTGNKVFTSMTFNKVPARLYGKKFSTKAFVKYTTVDGTTVETVEADYDAFTPAEIADAVLAHPMATQADKDYAAAIKAAVTQEGAA